MWTYDAGGNILTRSKYPFTSASEEVSGTPDETVSYSYSSGAWKDLLTAFDGKAITYDTIGNMLTMGDWESFDWEHGRELSTHSIPAEMAIITQPKDFKGVNDAPVEFSIKATGEDLTYLWQISDDNGSTWSQSTAATYNTATLSGFTVTPGKDGRLYRCIVTDGKGNKRISSAAELSLVPIAITNQPNNFYGYEGKAVSFSLTARGENLTYKWQLSGNDGATWYDSTATGYNTNALSGFTATEARNGNLYRCIVTDGSGNTVTSNEVKLNTTDFTIYRQPSNAWGILGDEVSFSVQTYSTTSVTYQWQYSYDGGENWHNSTASGNTTNTLSKLKITDARLGYRYRCVVTDGNGTTITSSVARMRLKTDTWRHTYDANGMRTQRTDGNTTYKYIYNGGSLRRMTVGDEALTFGYDASGKPMYVQWDGARYFYLTNIQGDVVGLLDSSGSVVVTYAYDAWGNILSIGGDQADDLGKLNPLRYRGYVYDTETGLYYLQSRYYNPEMGRFINADDVGYLGAGGFVSYNLFAYCWNDPVNLLDKDGKSPEAALLWTNSMWWLCLADTALPIGDAIYGLGIVVLGVCFWEQTDIDISELSVVDADVTYGPPSPNNNNDDDDDDYYDDDSNFGGRQKIGRHNGNTPGNNQAQNKQFKDATKDILSKDQQRALHNEISGKGFGFRDIVDAAKNLWILFVGLFDADD